MTVVTTVTCDFYRTSVVTPVTSVTVDWAAFSPAELWLILGVGALGGLAGLQPAIKGSLTEVADNLAPTT